MPDIKEFKQRLQALAEIARAKLPDIATTLTITAKALAERRIKEQGFNAQYSDTQIPAWFFDGKELNGQGTKFLEQHGVFAKGKGPGKKGKKKDKAPLTKEERLANWKEFRQAQGLPIGFVDLTYSGKMFAAMGPLTVQINNNIYSAPLGAGNKQAQSEMNYNFIRYGDFIGIALQPEDFNLLGEFVQSELYNILQTSNLKP
jgi:hypothetical protein